MKYGKIFWAPALTMCLFLMPCWPPPAVSHPHVFISQYTTVAFDDSGLAGFRIHWTFDDMFSVMIQEDFDSDHDGRLSPEEVSVIREKAFGYIAEYNYFIHIKINDTPFEVKHVTDFTARLDNGKLSYEFFVPCHVKAANTPKQIILSAYDTEYYSDIYIPDQRAVALERSSAFRVETRVQRDMDTLFYYETVNPMAVFVNFRQKS